MLKPYAKIVITGDSVTDCGRARPTGARNTGLGNGYPFFVDTALAALYPEQRIFTVNTGIGGNTSCQLRDRFDTDVLEHNPDLVTIMIGINNVWRHFDIGSYFPKDLEKLAPARYEQDLREMIEKTLAHKAALILITPYYLETNLQNPMRRMCDEYADIVRHLAKEYGVVLCDMQKAFDAFLAKESAYLLSADRVHPNNTGHYVIATELLKAMEQISL